MHNLSGIWSTVTSTLFPALESAGHPVVEQYAELIVALEFIKFEDYATANLRAPGIALGRPSVDRRFMLRAFLAKMHLNIPTTKELRQRLTQDACLRLICGWEQAKDVPSEATFSRAFSQIASSGLLETIHAAQVTAQAAKQPIDQVNRDATDIHARERPVLKPKLEEKPKHPVGRPKKGEPPRPKAPSRMVAQLIQSPEQSLKELPTQCDIGCKRNSHAHSMHWVGYKAHVDVANNGLPLLFCLTSASMHDNQIAIPMMKLTVRRVNSKQQVMDAGYDADFILQQAVLLNQRAVIASSGRRKHPHDMTDEEKAIYKNRSASERFNSDLKDNHGGRTVRVRGHRKVLCHLMFGVLVIFAKTLIRQV